VSRALLFALALLPQLVLVAAIAAREEIGRATGTEVVLEVRAVDPMDLLSGRYVTIPLAISVLERERFPDFVKGFEHDDEVFVLLRPGERHWEAGEVRLDRPSAPDGPFLRGRVRHLWVPDPERDLFVEYEIDRFYIPHDAADPSVWDANGNRRHELAVVARVDSRGRPHVVDLLVDGRPYEEWNRAQTGR